jgi:hypothetical protein
MKHSTILKLFELMTTSDGKHHIVTRHMELTKGMDVIVRNFPSKEMVLATVTHVNNEQGVILARSAGNPTMRLKMNTARQVVVEHDTLIRSMITAPHSGDNPLPYHDLTDNDLKTIITECGGSVWMEMKVSNRIGRIEHTTGRTLVPKTLHDRYILKLYKPELPESVALSA